MAQRSRRDILKNETDGDKSRSYKEKLYSDTTLSGVTEEEETLIVGFQLLYVQIPNFCYHRIVQVLKPSVAQTKQDSS